MRNSQSIPDDHGKTMRHYVNGVDDSDGMHPGIRKNCQDPICIRIREKLIGNQSYGKGNEYDPFDPDQNDNGTLFGPPF